ncbi:hypothetical protein RJ640_029561, partial [Escallonia rubra]
LPKTMLPKVMRLKALLVLLMTVFSPQLQETKASMAKPGCQEKCGNLTVPYPFGIGANCYLDKPFQVLCKDEVLVMPSALLHNLPIFGNPIQIPYFSSGFSVLEITLEFVRVAVAATPSCFSASGSGSMGDAGFGMDQQFSYSHTHNKFVGIGCDIFAYFITFGSNYTGGCAALCNHTNPVVGLSGTGCSGAGCCQSTIAQDMRAFYLQISSINTLSKPWISNPCSIGFIAERNFSGFMLNISDTNIQNNVYNVPVVLDWVAGNTNCQEASKKEKYGCGDNTNCINSAGGLGYQCRCLQGYRGNPYLPSGCQDINECMHPEDNLCRKGTTCVNIPGSYLCNCPRGYQSDGTGIAAVVLLSTAFGACIWHKLEKRKKFQIKQKFFKRNGGLLLQKHISSTNASLVNKHYTAEEIEKATDNFSKSRVLGRGGHGTVYKGMLPDGSIVAVKKANTVDTDRVGQFINEVFILSQINHRNIVKLLGCCLEYEVPLLVYEYVSNGTLADHVHGEGHVSALSWETRLSIAAEVAGALAYMHSCASTAIFHRDIKSGNILLDENYRAVVSDFGLSRSVALNKTHLTMSVGGTFGYLDPEYFHSGQFTAKSDVYAFGVVLAEILTGRKAVSLNSSDEGLASHFRFAMKHNRLFDILETFAVNDCKKAGIHVVAELSERCLRRNPKKRPSMKEIAAELDRLREEPGAADLVLVPLAEAVVRELGRIGDLLSGAGADLGLLELPCFSEDLLGGYLDWCCGFVLNPSWTGELYLYFFPAFSLQLQETQASMAKPNCQEKCGNLTVPYPHSALEPTCPVHNMRYSIHSEWIFYFLEITLELVRVEVGAAPSCYSISGLGSMLAATFGMDRQFSYSCTHTKFVGIGCDIFAYVISFGSNYTGGCAALCDYTNPIVGLSGTSCSGAGYHQSTIPRDMRAFELHISNVNTLSKPWTNSPCSINGFIADMNFSGFMLYISDTNIHSKVYNVPVMLDWVAGNTNCQEASKKKKYGCGHNTNCINSAGSLGPIHAAAYKVTKGTLTSSVVAKIKHRNIMRLLGCCLEYEVPLLVYEHEYVSNGTLADHAHGEGHVSALSWEARLSIAGEVAGALAYMHSCALPAIFQRDIKCENILLDENHRAVVSDVGLSRSVALDKIHLTISVEGTFGYLDPEYFQSGKFTVKSDVYAFGVVLAEILTGRKAVSLNSSDKGCCLEYEVPLLVYEHEYVSNGTLADHAHGEGHVSALSWEARLSIAGEVAGALAYMHSCALTAIFQRDIKCENILLDENHRAVVSDVGLSRSVALDKIHLTISVEGTFGYLDPEYFQSGKFTVKSDVYAFGVVLAEILTGRKAVSLNSSDKGLASHFRLVMKRNRLLDTLETFAFNEGHKAGIHIVAELAKRCLRRNPKKRPSMKEITAELDQLREVQ